MGDSSGGHTAVLAGITAGQDILDTEDYNEFSCEVKAIVDFYGVTDVRQKEDFPTTLNQGEPDSPEGKLIGGNNVYEHPEHSVPVTCAKYVEQGMTPYLGDRAYAFTKNFVKKKKTLHSICWKMRFMAITLSGQLKILTL